MSRKPDLRFDVATALSQGARDYQEDTLAADFSLGGDFGFTVLADGMGGHRAGDIASKIVVTEVFSELKFQATNPTEFLANVPRILRWAAASANDCVRLHTKSNPGTEGMGATLIATVLSGDRLYWISIGDSPLFLFRNGELKQLNEDHSLAPQIDFMVRSGMMDEEVGRNHPDRNCLTSVIYGSEIERIDCPEHPFELCEGDLIIAASDGLQFLSDDRLASILGASEDVPSDDLAQKIVSEINDLADPDQDNVAFSLIRVLSREKLGDMGMPRFMRSASSSPGRPTTRIVGGLGMALDAMRRS